MKKIALYTLMAMILGLSLTLVPLLTITEIKTDNDYSLMPEYLGKESGKYDGPPYSGGVTSYSTGGVEILAISFVIALVVYVWVKHRTPSRDYRRITFPPY